MDKKQMRHSESELKQLTKKYFEATLSPEEEQRLLSFAKEFAGNGGSSPFITDAVLQADLRLIADMSSLGEEMIRHMADSAPEALELRLENHISNLAEASRRHKTLIPAWLKFSSAAAVAVLAVTAGLHVVEKEAATPHHDTIFVAKNTPETTPASVDEKASAPLPVVNSRPVIAQASTPKENSGRSRKRQRPDDRQTGGPAVIPESVTQALAVININEAEVEESASALAMVPTISEDVREVMPTMIEAKIETDRLLLQPMTTLSQSFDNVYESVAILSEAFSGIASTFNAVNTSLSTLSEPVNLSM